MANVAVRPIDLLALHLEISASLGIPLAQVERLSSEFIVQIESSRVQKFLLREQRIASQHNALKLARVNDTVVIQSVSFRNILINLKKVLMQIGSDGAVASLAGAVLGLHPTTAATLMALHAVRVLLGHRSIVLGGDHVRLLRECIQLHVQGYPLEGAHLAMLRGILGSERLDQVLEDLTKLKIVEVSGSPSEVRIVDRVLVVPGPPEGTAKPPKVELAVSKLQAIVALAVEEGLQDRRRILTAGLSPRVAASLPQHDVPRDQLLSDLVALSRIQDGASSLAEYLKQLQEIAFGESLLSLVDETLEQLEPPPGSNTKRGSSQTK